MNTVKFVVILFFVTSCAAYLKYCEICANHILCQYTTPGPGRSCIEYERNLLLTNDDIYDLVNQINERRNFIALGHSRHLPSAANMNKLVWSEELATFAQRWVDQCDPSLRPDKEDHCRDLEHTNVGQNIASIINPSPTFSVKSFIEMWFMQLLDYKGSVTYYDQFQDHVSKYFTQLIWAETESFGCGRAKFKVNNVTVDRIVCNFSPRGNIQGKPIYAIGYPRTQCQNPLIKHRKFPGLCAQSFSYKAKLPATNPSVSSLLKILNLSNDSVKQEIDPIYNNMKQIIPRRSEMENPKHQIMRHIFGNKLQSKRPDFPRQRAQKFWENPLNDSRNYKEHSHNREKGYSSLDHKHVYKFNDQPTKINEMDYYRKYIETSKGDFDDYGQRNKFKKQCTRSTETHNSNCENNSKLPQNQDYHQCTRGRISNWQIQQNTKMPATNTISHELCPCSIHHTSLPSSNPYHKFTLNCECVNVNGVTIHCPKLRTFEESTRNRNADLESDLLFKDTYPNPENEYEWSFNKRRKNIAERKRSRYVQSNRYRYKRDFGDLSTLKPFWKIDSFSFDGNPQLKALKYTTLHNKRQQKTKKYQSKPFTTESITIHSKNTNMKAVTEKYLSFDELLHLRKFNLSGNNARRKLEPQILRNPADDKTTVVTESTTEESSSDYTANTPFKRMKHCTRKLTCTWTAASITDSNGSVVGNVEHGSRTPPGYVEGCTRTSTCTRDYMNRNKFPSTTISSTNDDADDDNNDSDYCERRSLNVEKRSSHKKRSCSQKCVKEVSDEGHIQVSYNKVTSDFKLINYDNFRKKRSFNKSKCCINNNLSYGDLYYLVLSKIVKQWENKKINYGACPCNSESEKGSYLNVMLFFFIIFIFF